MDPNHNTNRDEKAKGEKKQPSEASKKLVHKLWEVGAQKARAKQAQQRRDAGL